MLDYDSITGIFIWKVRESEDPHIKRFNTVFGNKVAGYHERVKNRVYLKISLKGKQYLAHRLAYLIVYNEWAKPLDHKDGDGLNNAISNLIKTTYAANSINQILGKSKSGYIGVRQVGNLDKWKAYICFEGKDMALGTFETKEEAIHARKQADIKYGYDKIIFARQL